MEEKKKGNGGLIVIIVLLLLTTLGLGGFIVYDKLITPEKDCTTEKEDKEEKETKKEETKKEETKTSEEKYCEGTYTYNDGITPGDGKLHKQVYTLKNDGTFTGSMNDTSKEEGTYTIKEDTIVFVYHPETYGGPDSQSYTSKAYYIASDCSYMSYNGTDSNLNQIKIKLTK